MVRGHRMKENKTKTSVQEYLGALWRYLQSPKTIFDIKDRTKALLLFVVVIIILQGLVKILFS